MALRDQPYLPLYVDDFMVDEKLRECSAESTGVYIRLMCLMHKSAQYGMILLKQKDKQTSSRCLDFARKLALHFPYTTDVIQRALEELVSNDVIQMDDDKIAQRRMVKDFHISEVRSKAGKKGGDKSAFGRDFAQAKTQANSVSVSVIESENKKQGEKASADETPYEDIQSLWNNAVRDLPKVQKMTDVRKRHTRARFDEDGWDGFVDVFKRVNESDFLSGRVERSSFRAGFDWVLNPSNWLKIKEGNYVNQKKGDSDLLPLLDD